MNRWQDVTEAVYGGGEPEPASVIVEKAKHELRVIETYSYPEKRKHEESSVLKDIWNSSIVSVVLHPVTLLCVAIVIVLMVAYSNYNWNTDYAPCYALMSRRVAEFPVRCLDEIKEYRK